MGARVQKVIDNGGSPFYREFNFVFALDGILNGTLNEN